jgi:hypothetical protein
MITNEALTEAIQLIKSGRKAEAQLILEPYIQSNPQNIQAWMWEAELFPNDVDKIKVLEICLEHNPEHPQVTQALTILRKRAGIFSVPEPVAPPPVILPDVPPPPLPLYDDEPEQEPVIQPVSRPAEKPAARTSNRERPIERKHPDWPLADGMVENSEIRVLTVNRIPMYFAEIDAMYVAQGRDYGIKFKYAKKTSISPFNAEILTSTYASGTGIKVSYNPHNPSRGWVDEWDPKVVKRKLREFKDRPEVREAISRRYKSRMMNGFWLTLAGIAVTIIGSMISAQLGGFYVLFYGMIIFGIFYFLSGLVGWLWNMD